MEHKQEDINSVIQEFNLVEGFLNELEENGSCRNQDLGIGDDIDACAQELRDKHNLSWDRMDDIYDLVRVAFDKAEEIARRKYSEMHQEKQPVKINESQLRQIIREALNEYRPYQKDGDVEYVGPDPDKDYLSGFTPYGSTPFSHGKGSMCSKIADAVKNMFYQNDKIEWTDAEKEYIDDIYHSILRFAEFTKQEGNKKRGYNGYEAQH